MENLQEPMIVVLKTEKEETERDRERERVDDTEEMKQHVGLRSEQLDMRRCINLN